MFSTTNRPLRRRRDGGVPQTVPLKGLFADGIWQCNCAPRLPAEHFQTKNGGRNHGRWFYTCQKPQPSRCGFFLWDDEARPREAGAVLLNARSEAAARKGGATSPQPAMPDTPSKAPRSLMNPAPTTPSPPEEFYDWPPSDADADNDDLLSPSRKRIMPPPPSSPPRKAVRTDALATPTKRSHAEMAFPTPSTTGKPHPTTPTAAAATAAADDDDVFTTPATAPHARTLFSPASMPSPAGTPRPQHARPRKGSSALEAEILDALGESGVAVGAEGRAAVRGVCERWEMRLRGVERGREVVRAAVRGKEARIAELVGRVEGLEGERE
ncbi:hypothetical protein MMC32_001121, partial [Xylographa parallela]|nr:hypothetical protein [Xylographa parallela]